MSAPPTVISEATPDTAAPLWLDVSAGVVSISRVAVPGVTTTTTGPQVDVVTSLDEAPKSITTTLDGATRTWNFPDGWYVSVYEGKTLADGTIFVLAVDGSNGDAEYVIQLAPDGSAYAYRSFHSAAANAEFTVDENGFVVLGAWDTDDDDDAVDTFGIGRAPLATSPADGTVGSDAGTVGGHGTSQTTAAATPQPTATAIGRCDDFAGLPTDNQPVDFFQTGGSCQLPDGGVVTPGLQFSPCNDGSSLWWNDVGWGFMGADNSTWSTSFDGLPAWVAGQCSAPAPTPTTAADVTTAAPIATDPAPEPVATDPAPVEVPITTTA